MARYRFRRYFRRRYRRRGNTINQKAYQKARIDAIYPVHYPQNQGTFAFYRNNLPVNIINPNDILQDSMYYDQVRSLWGYSKLIGVAVTFMPSPNIRNHQGLRDWTAVGGWMFGNQGGANFQSILASDNSIMLNPFGPVRKYVSIKGSTWWSNAMGEAGTGTLAVQANQNGTADSEINFICKVSLYLTLSKSNL